MRQKIFWWKEGRQSIIGNLIIEAASSAKVPIAPGTCDAVQLAPKKLNQLDISRRHEWRDRYGIISSVLRFCNNALFKR